MSNFQTQISFVLSALSEAAKWAILNLQIFMLKSEGVIKWDSEEQLFIGRNKQHIYLLSLTVKINWVQSQFFPSQSGRYTLTMMSQDFPTWTLKNFPTFYFFHWVMRTELHTKVKHRLSCIINLIPPSPFSWIWYPKATPQVKTFRHTHKQYSSLETGFSRFGNMNCTC